MTYIVDRSSDPLSMGSVRLWAGVLVLAGLAVGCEDAKIREVRIPREKSGLDAPQFQADGRPIGMGAMSNSAATARLLIAMIDRPNATYFLRIQSPTVEAVDAVRKDFDQIVQSLTFDNNSLQWKLPSGWTEREGGAEFRIATLKAPSNLEVFVTKLTPGQQVLANVNRWQGQLGLPELSGSDLPIETIQVGEQKVILYDARRSSSSPGSGGLPPGSTPGNQGSSSVPVPPGAGPTRESMSVPFTFPPLPAEWKTLPPTMALARWEQQNESGSLKLDVFKFPAEASFMEMVSIWGERIQASPPTEATFTQALSPMTIAGQEAQFAIWPTATEGDASAKVEKSIQVARVKLGTEAWYIKLEGDHSAVVEFADQFKEFLANITMVE